MNSEFDILKVEESFISLFKSNSFVSALWESVLENKARYIFRSKMDNCNEHIQKIFDYISSPLQKNKRESQISNLLLQRELGFLKRVFHEVPFLRAKEIQILAKST